MNWYEKLSRYFPVEEMKSKEHMELLLDEKEVYHKEEGTNYVMMYAEFPTFIFVDYLFVSKDARGQGLGKRLLDKLKQKEKPIILEVEPASHQDIDTQKRQRFYQREGFHQATSIEYKRRSLATGQINELEILYWAPHHESEEEIYNAMKKMYREIHTYKDVEVYGDSYQEVDEVLSFEKQENN